MPQDAAQKLWLAALGILTMAQAESAKLFEALVDVGKQVEQAIPSPSEALRDAVHTTEQAWERLQQLIDAQVVAALHRLGVPTKDEIDLLTKRIEQLTEAIEALRARS